MLTFLTGRGRWLAHIIGALLVLYVPQVAAQSSSNLPAQSARPEFVKFQATNHNAAPLLIWTIDQAHDAAFFEVLSWVGESELKPIGRVAATGTNTRYTFRVPASAKQKSSKVYYQIRLTTRQDSVTYSPVRTLGAGSATSADGPVPAGR